MKKIILIPIFATLMLLFVSNDGNAQTKATSTVQVIQFHSEHRCMTCNKIEELARVALKKYPTVPFSLINADDKKNEKQLMEAPYFCTTLKPKKSKI
jgi:phosphoribosylanthranilate isomerase